jgi:citrate lyase subunit beta / citryl-CoA lyase
MSGSHRSALSALAGPAILFCPADRPERYVKAAAAADLVILDLEDAVGADRKQVAREAVVHQPLDPDRTIIRINGSGNATEHTADLEALRMTPYRMVMVPKAENADEIVALRPWSVIALCETPAGVIRAPAIAAAPNVIGMMWGAEDLVSAMGGRSSRSADGQYRDIAVHARSSVLLAAGARNLFRIDSVYLDIEDEAGLEAEAFDAVESGFTHKACIHPRQVSVVRRAFFPTADQIESARRVLDASAAGGVSVVDGRMIDAPLIAQARAVLRSAGIET